MDMWNSYEAISPGDRKKMSAVEKPKDQIEAIYYGELSKLEDNFVDKLVSGELKCSYCEKPLKTVGIHSVEKRDNKLVWCCQQYSCITKSAE